LSFVTQFSTRLPGFGISGTNCRLVFTLFLSTWLLSTSAVCPGQEAPAPADTTGSGTSVLFPLVGYTPETKFLAGATYLRFFQLGGPEDTSRASMLSPLLVVTTKKQIIIQLGSDLYWNDGGYHAVITPEYQRFPDSFFGIGRDTRDSDKEDYTPEQVSVSLLFERRILDDLSVGMTYGIKAHRIIKTESGGLLDSGDFRGTEKTLLSIPGLRLSWDSRDHAMSPQRGVFAQAEAKFSQTGLGSDYRFTEIILDLRRYWPLGSKGILAAQVMGKAQTGEPPFFVLARLGGFEGLRGYLSSRYPDQSRLFARTEWRSPDIWKGLGCAVFAGYGDVAPSVDKLTTSAQLYTYGVGLRYLLSRQEKVRVRIDMGFGNGDSGFYVGLGEAF
jgi:hypothetical protein